MIRTADANWFSTLSEHARFALTRLDARNSQGNEKVLIAPAFQDVDDADLFARLDVMLGDARLDPELRLIEDNQRAKFGPRSLAKSWSERRSSLFKYFDHTQSIPDIELIQASIGSRLRPLSLPLAARHLVKSSSAGLPFMRRKGDIVSEVVRNYQSLIGRYPCVLFTRTAELGKTRNVWGFPVADTLREVRYQRPFHDLERTWPHRAALLGPVGTDLGVHSVLSRMDGRNIVSLDFEDFDATINPNVSQQCFNHITRYFQPAERDELADVGLRFTTIPIVCPEGVIDGSHGIPSGSGFTNTVGSLVQLLVATHVGLNPRSYQVQGDDGVYSLDDKDMFSLLSAFTRFGLRVNEDKTRISHSRSCVYLQRYYKLLSDGSLYGGGGVYPITRALNRLKYLGSWTNLDELEMPGQTYFSIRAVMILENCKHHPAFRDLVIYAAKLDREKLNFDRSYVPAYSKMLKPRVQAGVVENVDVWGIESFETVKILKRL